MTPFSGHHRVALSSSLRICCAVFAAATLFINLTVAPRLQASTPEAGNKVYQCKPGPWGDLEYSYIYLEMPDHLVDRFPKPDPTPQWNFPGATEQSLRTLFEHAGLPEEFQNETLNPARRVLKDHVLTVFPPLRGLMAMHSEQRAIIYRELAKTSLNPYHFEPVYITNGDADSWFAHSEMRTELRDLVEHMTYMRSDVICFSDLPAVLSLAKTEKDAHDLFRAMSRTRSMVLRLKLKSQADLEKAMHYWSAFQPKEDIEPILRSIAETAGSEPLDCIHLLPTIPRSHLYTYPSEEHASLGFMPDCHWTSLNFFNATPVNYEFDVRSFTPFIKEGYNTVTAPYDFGDLLMLVAADGAALHSCIYIADDIVYTKNGESLASPWLLMKLGDIRRFYSGEQKISIQGFRLKSHQRPPAHS